MPGRNAQLAEGDSISVGKRPHSGYRRDVGCGPLLAVLVFLGVVALVVLLVMYPQGF